MCCRCPGQTDEAAAVEGAAIFAENCAACHGEDGGGHPGDGRPSLNDAIWLYGGEPEQIAAQIYRPRLGVMPTWQGRLDDETIKMLAVYVHALGGGHSRCPASAPRATRCRATAAAIESAFQPRVGA